MRNIPFAFLNEETIDLINRAAEERAKGVDGFANLARTQRSMREFYTLPEGVSPAATFGAVLKRSAKRLVALLEKMMEMSGPNSIANLERALRAQNQSRN